MASVDVGRFSKSVRPFKSNEEYLYAVKEDLAEWLNGLHSVNLSPEDFFNTIEDGIMLCQHANKVREYLLAAQIQSETIKYKREVKKQSWQARDNVASFISWVKAHLSVNDVLLFETDDLVLRKNIKSVLLCLLQVAREGSKFGMDVPMLVQMEKEIDIEIEMSKNPECMPTEKPLDQPDPAKLKEAMEMLKSLDELVQDSLRRCTCPNQFPMYEVGRGKYRIGESKTVVFVRVLRNHVMVRVGGGWDTLANYLDKHDPCRCSGGGHRKSKISSSAQMFNPSDRPSAPASSPPSSPALTAEPTLSHRPATPVKELSSVSTKESPRERLRNRSADARRPTTSSGSSTPRSLSSTRVETSIDTGVETSRKKTTQPRKERDFAQSTNQKTFSGLVRRQTFASVGKNGSNRSLNEMDTRPSVKKIERRRNTSFCETSRTMPRSSSSGSLRGDNREQFTIRRDGKGSHRVTKPANKPTSISAKSTSSSSKNVASASAPLPSSRSTPASPAKRASSEPPRSLSLPTSPTDGTAKTFPPVVGRKAHKRFNGVSNSRRDSYSHFAEPQLSPSSSSSGTCELNDSLTATALEIKEYFSENSILDAIDGLCNESRSSSRASNNETSFSVATRKAPRHPGKTKIPGPVIREGCKDDGEGDTHAGNMLRVDSGVELFSPKSSGSDEAY